MNFFLLNMTSDYVAKKNVNHDIHMSLANQYFRSFTTNTTPTAKHTTLLPSHYKLPLDKIQPLLTRINTFKIEDTKVHSSLYRNIYRLHQNWSCKWLQNHVDSTMTHQVRTRLHWLESPWFIHFCFILMQKSILFWIPTDQNVTTMRWRSFHVILLWICLCTCTRNST